MKRRVLYCATALPMMALLWGFFLEPDRLLVTHAEIGLVALPDAFDGFRVVAVSDVHAGGNFIGPRKLEQLVELVNAQHADLVVLLGDYVKGNRTVPPQMPLPQVAGYLGRMRARHGVLAVLGNHDVWVGAYGVMSALRAAGVPVIDNKVAAVERGGDRIHVMGVPDFMTQPQTEFGALPADGMVMAITHSPDVFPHLPARVSLTVAGHTHGGQVWLPVVGRMVVPSVYGDRYAAGLAEEDERKVYVTTGVGTSILPVRFLVPPEIAVLTLRRVLR